MTRATGFGRCLRAAGGLILNDKTFLLFALPPALALSSGFGWGLLGEPRGPSDASSRGEPVLAWALSALFGFVLGVAGVVLQALLVRRAGSALATARVLRTASVAQPVRWGAVAGWAGMVGAAWLVAEAADRFVGPALYLLLAAGLLVAEFFTFLVVPALAVEGGGILDAVGRTWTLVLRHVGAVLGGFLLVPLLAVIPVLLVFGGTVALLLGPGGMDPGDVLVRLVGSVLLGALMLPVFAFRWLYAAYLFHAAIEEETFATGAIRWRQATPSGAAAGPAPRAAPTVGPKP